MNNESEIRFIVGHAERRWLAEEDWLDLGICFGIRAIAFKDWTGLMSTLPPKRMELLTHVRDNPAKTFRALAHALGRDVKRVWTDVSVLLKLGLIVRSKEGITCPHTKLTILFKLHSEIAK